MGAVEIVIGADTEMVFRTPAEDGKAVTNRYRVRNRMVELLED